MKKILLTLGTVAAVAAPVASVVACGSNDSVKAINLSVKGFAQPNLTKLPTTSWESVVAWDRNMFLFEKGSKALDNVLSSTKAKSVLTSPEFTSIISDLKAKLRALTSNDALYAGINTPIKVDSGKPVAADKATPQLKAGMHTLEDKDKIPSVAIELMEHNGPFKTVAEAKIEQAKSNAGKTSATNIIFEVLYIKTTDMGTFLDNANKLIVDELGTTNADELNVWNAIYTESKAAL